MIADKHADTGLYSCGTCASEVLVLTAKLTLGQSAEWLVRCGKGHPVVPVPGTRIEAR